MQSKLRASKKLHQNAKNLVKQYGVEFTEAILLASELVSDREGTDEVQTPHVVEARKIVFTLGQKSDRKWQIKLALAFFLMGISATGLATEFNIMPARPFWFLGFSGVGFLGLLCFAWAVSTK